MTTQHQNTELPDDYKIHNFISVDKSGNRVFDLKGFAGTPEGRQKLMNLTRPAKAVQGECPNSGKPCSCTAENNCVTQEERTLTPESEGIAGKWDYWMVQEYAEKNRLDYNELCALVRESTLTRPQEIDVESLVNEVMDKICTNPEHSKTGMRLVVSAIVQSAIDLLAASGNLK